MATSRLNVIGEFILLVLELLLEYSYFASHGDWGNIMYLRNQACEFDHVVYW